MFSEWMRQFFLPSLGKAKKRREPNITAKPERKGVGLKQNVSKILFFYSSNILYFEGHTQTDIRAVFG